jgi:hypothetical protein
MAGWPRQAELWRESRVRPAIGSSDALLLQTCSGCIRTPFRTSPRDETLEPGPEYRHAKHQVTNQHGGAHFAHDPEEPDWVCRVREDSNLEEDG